MLSTVFHRVKRQRRLGLSPSRRCIKFATTCVDLIKIRLGDFVCETESDPHAALGLSNSGCSLVLLLKCQLIDRCFDSVGEEGKKPEHERTYRSLINNFYTVKTKEESSSESKAAVSRLNSVPTFLLCR